MTLGEFLNHIKHKSLKIEIITYDKNTDILFNGTVGEYQTSIIKSKINNVITEGIFPYSDIIRIYIDYKEE